MIFTISDDPMYLIEVTSNQNHQAKIDLLREPSNTELFFIESTIWPLHTNTAPKQPATTIGFVPHCHNPETTTVSTASPVDQCLQQFFHPYFTRHQVITDTTTSNTPPGTIWMWTFQTSSIPTQPDPKVRHPDCLKTIWNYPETHSLHQAITPYSSGLPPHWLIKIPYSLSVPVCGISLPWKILSKLHYRFLITCQQHSQCHNFSWRTPCLKIPPTYHCGGWQM